MKWLECKIDVVECEYFSILYSLGLAKFKQQSIEMKFNYIIVELFYYLFIFKVSKWKILIVAVGVMGFVFMVFMILFLEFLDINIKDVCWVEKKIGLLVIVIYFKLVCCSCCIDVDYLKDWVMDVILFNVAFVDWEKEANFEVFFVNFFIFIQKNDGKMFIGYCLLNKLVGMGYYIFFFIFENEDDFIEEGVYDYWVFFFDSKLYVKEWFFEFNLGFSFEQLSIYDFIFVEVLLIILKVFLVKFFYEVDYIYLVVCVNCFWSEVDRNVMKVFWEIVLQLEFSVIFNGVEFLEMEFVLGDLFCWWIWVWWFIKNVFWFRFFLK